MVKTTKSFPMTYETVGNTRRIRRKLEPPLLTGISDGSLDEGQSLMWEPVFFEYKLYVLGRELDAREIVLLVSYARIGWP